MIRRTKQECASYFEGTVSGSFPPLIPAIQTLAEHPSTGHGQVQQEYLAWRMIWYAYKLDPSGELENRGLFVLGANMLLSSRDP